MSIIKKRIRKLRFRAGSKLAEKSEVQYPWKWGKIEGEKSKPDGGSCGGSWIPMETKGEIGEKWSWRKMDITKMLIKKIFIELEGKFSRAIVDVVVLLLPFFLFLPPAIAPCSTSPRDTLRRQHDHLLKSAHYRWAEFRSVLLCIVL